MGKSPCCAKDGLNRGAWTAVEDKILVSYIKAHGEGKWRSLPKKAGLNRCGKSCRLRWLNYLRPGIKRGNISRDEEDLIMRLHKLLGNRWSLIAGRLPGRTDNEIKNYWNTTLGKRAGIPDHLSPSANSGPDHGLDHPGKNARKRDHVTNISNVRAWLPQPAADTQQPAIRTKAMRCTKFRSPSVRLLTQNNDQFPAPPPEQLSPHNGGGPVGFVDHVHSSDSCDLSLLDFEICGSPRHHDVRIVAASASPSLDYCHHSSSLVLEDLPVLDDWILKLYDDQGLPDSTSTITDY